MSMESVFNVLRLVCFIALSIVMLVVVYAEASAHDFYDGWCCNNNDCAPYLGEVRTTRDGYYLPEFDVTIPYTRPKVTPDSIHPAVKNGARYDMPGDDPYEYHLCEYPIGSKTVRCFYAKQGGT